MSLTSAFGFAVITALCCLAATHALAQGLQPQAPAVRALAPAPVFLGRSDLQAELIGKVWLGSRGVYGAMTQVSYLPDHRIEVLSVDKSSTRKGTWEINADGQLCVTWAPVGSPPCYLYSRSGQKLIVYLATDRDQPHAELLPKKTVN